MTSFFTPSPRTLMQAEQDSRMAAVGKSKLNVNLTPEMIQQIFAEKPHVKRAYLTVRRAGVCRREWF